MDEKALEAAARAVADEEGYRYSERRRKWDRIAKTAIAAYLQARREAGFVEVPVEPTEEMVQPYPMLKGKIFCDSLYPGDMRAIYRAMIDAWLASLA